MQVTEIPISNIHIKSGRRELNPEKVAQIADSITAVGLLHPIAVNKNHELVAGHHRLEAFKRLGKDTIPAITTENGLTADLAEIDENLIRQELSVLERGECLGKRKEIYEALYPQPLKGGPGRGHTEKQRNNFVPFTENTAQQIGSSRRTIEHELQIASNIAPDIKDSIRNTDLANNKNELLKLARLDNEIQHNVIDALKDSSKTVDEIVRDITMKQRIQDREKERERLLRDADSALLPEEMTLYHGNCRELFPDIMESIQRKWPNADIFILTDPPYNINFEGYDTYRDTMPDTDYIDMMRMFSGLPSAIIQYPEQMMSLICPALGTPDEVLCWCYNTNISKAFRLINIYNAKPDFNLVRQPYKNPSDKRIQNRIMQGSTGAALYDWFADIQLEKNVSQTKCFHPCQVPVSLMERLIILLTRETSIIVDPFMGVGTTGLACQRLKRRFIGIELSDEYYKLAKGRLGK